MRAIPRWCVRLTFVVSSGILLTTFAGADQRGGGYPLRFEPDHLVIDQVLQPGTVYVLDAVVVNESNQPARLIGAGDCSARCLYSGEGLPTTIKARGRGTVTVHVQTGAPGEFSGGMPFYTDRPSQSTLILKLAGTIREGRPSDASSHKTNP